LPKFLVNPACQFFSVLDFALNYRPLAIAVLALLCPLPARAAPECVGLPRLAVTTPAGTCVQRVQAGLRFPRGVLELSDSVVYVAEMGAWMPRKGRLSVLRMQAGVWTRETVFEQLDRPHQLRLGPDGHIYVGVVGGIFRFSPKEEKPMMTWVIGGTSNVKGPTGTGLHGLTAFEFNATGDLIVNNGSATNQCEAASGQIADRAQPCPETLEALPRAALLRYPMRWPEGMASPPVVLAAGLRNSMALAAHPSGTLLQGENARDAIAAADPALDDEKLPHDELNVIVPGKHYGWPYCYDMNETAPEYRSSSALAQCATRTKPTLLLAPHAAPLAMGYAAAGSVAGKAARLVVAYHGYRAGGHRIVTFAVNAKGVPQGKAANLISDWQANAGLKQAMGAPTDLHISGDGSVWITEDRNGTLLRLVSEAGAK
jgi:glucose/arabinose dehydrogenase